MDYSNLVGFTDVDSSLGDGVGNEFSLHFNVWGRNKDIDANEF